MSDTYILNEKCPVRCKDILKWAKWFESANRRVAESVGKNKIRVSTVFLGLDHSFSAGPPMLFETMIFGGEYDQYQNRCSTWEQAEIMHKKACALAGAKS